eukprot:Hpha_TRINITY_DN35417_c0_g1::TRINITY_DN35417_c0_g1_i1::g.83465::m.83465/K18183/COX19; cytochrome c oxidase assembly protein subunit 19
MARPSTRQTVKPPDLGSFPLDHLNECRGVIEDYFRCLARNENLAPKCREEARVYLQCRMERGLMTPESTDKWLPRTDFVDRRKEVMEHARQTGVYSQSPLMRELAMRELPHGYEVPRVEVAKEDFGELAPDRRDEIPKF